MWPEPRSRSLVARLQQAYEQSGAIKRVLRLHLLTQLLQLQNVAACNAVHPVECRMARWLLEIHAVLRTARYD